MVTRCDNPPMVPPGVDGLDSLSGRWWVAHTRSRFEKAFAWDLLARGIGYFLPMVERTKVSGGRRRRVLLPLFGGYVFFCGTDEQRYVAMQTNRLCQTIEVIEQDKLLGELLHVERSLAGKASLELYPHTAVGQRCRIAAGPFQGLEGVVVQSRASQAVLVLQVSILGQGASMEVSRDLVEPVS